MKWYNMNESTIQQWRDAKTLADLGELTARWIEGSLSYHPCNYGSIDRETFPLQQRLAEYNRSGLLTTFSQPGESLDDEGYGQRACLEGYAQENLAKRIAAAGLYSDLLILIFPPGQSGGYQIPITVAEFHPFTWCGGCWGEDEIDCFATVISLEAIEALNQAWKVIVFDMQWGRDSYLWEYVSAVIQGHEDKRFDISPSPDLQLDTDFVF
jgi:hypothetical protein